MTDIKFMDLSENDNPVTTDSVLIGNTDNGLKRTTLGKLGDMFGVHGLFQLKQVSSPLQKDTIQYPVQAPVVDGYNFAFWLSSTSAEWTGATYVQDPTSAQTSIWIAEHPGTDVNNVIANAAPGYTPAVSAVAVYIKNSVA